MGENDGIDLTEARALLGVDAAASAAELRSAYRHRIKRWHPDRVASSPDSEEGAVRETQRLNAAYQLLRSARESDSPAHRSDSAGVPWTGRAIWTIDWNWWPLRAVFGGAASTRVGVAFWVVVLATFAALGWYFETQ